MIRLAVEIQPVLILPPTESDTDKTDSSAETTDESDSGKNEDKLPKMVPPRQKIFHANANAKTLLLLPKWYSVLLLCHRFHAPFFPTELQKCLKQALTPQIEEALKGFSNR